MSFVKVDTKIDSTLNKKISTSKMNKKLICKIHLISQKSYKYLNKIQ